MADPLLGKRRGRVVLRAADRRSDPSAADSWFVGLAARLADAGQRRLAGSLDTQCNEFFGDWAVRHHVRRLGAARRRGDLTGTAFGADKNPGPTGYVVATERAPSDTGTLWAGTAPRPGLRLEERGQRDGGNVTFDRIDTRVDADAVRQRHRGRPGEPEPRVHLVLGLQRVRDAAGTAPGHVFDVTYNPGSAHGDLEEHRLQPRRPADHRRRLRLRTATCTCRPTSASTSSRRGRRRGCRPPTGLPSVAVYGLTIDRTNRVLLRGHARPQRLAARAELAGKRAGGPARDRAGPPVSRYPSRRAEARTAPHAPGGSRGSGRGRLPARAAGRDDGAARGPRRPLPAGRADHRPGRRRRLGPYPRHPRDRFRQLHDDLHGGRSSSGAPPTSSPPAEPVAALPSSAAARSESARRCALRADTPLDPSLEPPGRRRPERGRRGDRHYDKGGCRR